MSSSVSNLDFIVQSQASKEITANALHDAASPATLFARRQSTSSGLTWGYYGGGLLIDGYVTLIPNGTLSLAASATNFIESTRSGAVSRNTTGFTPGRIPLYIAWTDGSTVLGYDDYRLATPDTTGRLAKTMSDANATLTEGESRNDILEFTGTLTAQRNVVLPLAVRQRTVFNNTAGGFGLQFIGATGTGVVVAAGKRAIVYGDGTNVVRVTADT